MKNLRDLEEALELSLEEFKENIKFEIDAHEGPYLTKDDMEQIARQTFYALNDFKKHIVGYLKDLK